MPETFWSDATGKIIVEAGKPIYSDVCWRCATEDTWVIRDGAGVAVHGTENRMIAGAGQTTALLRFDVSDFVGPATSVRLRAKVDSYADGAGLPVHRITPYAINLNLPPPVTWSEATAEGTNVTVNTPLSSATFLPEIDPGPTWYEFNLQPLTFNSHRSATTFDMALLGVRVNTIFTRDSGEGPYLLVCP